MLQQPTDLYVLVAPCRTLALMCATLRHASMAQRLRNHSTLTSQTLWVSAAWAAAPVCAALLHQPLKSLLWVSLACHVLPLAGRGRCRVLNFVSILCLSKRCLLALQTPASEQASECLCTAGCRCCTLMLGRHLPACALQAAAVGSGPPNMQFAFASFAL